MLLLAISHGAELLILDEPMDGLDPLAGEDLLRELTSLAATEGTTIFFSSHQIADVEQIADQCASSTRGGRLCRVPSTTSRSSANDCMSSSSRTSRHALNGSPVSHPFAGTDGCSRSWRMETSNRFSLNFARCRGLRWSAFRSA